jgi:penicillin amidase
MVVSLTEPIEAYGVYPGGQSGNPGSPYYDNFAMDWAKGNYYKLLFMQNPDDYADRLAGQQAFRPAVEKGKAY